MKKMMIATLAAASVLLAVANQAHAGATLDAVQKKGFVQCGISDGLPGFSYADADGKFSGIDVDVCRGVAAAVFGAQPGKHIFIPIRYHTFISLRLPDHKNR